MSFIQLNDRGWVVLYLAKQGKKIHISGDGIRVLIESRSSKKEYRAFSDDKIAETGTLPSKLKPWYSYAYQFVEAIKKKQPKHVVVVKKNVTLPKTAKNPQQEVRMKISSVYSLSGHIEATMKH